jgi:hypothetical protein
MFERFKSGRKLWNATKAATRVSSLISPCLFTASASGGGFDPKLTSDSFVMGYIYGVIMACDSMADREEQGYLIQQVFELLFPDHGKTATDYCALQAAERSPDFMRSAKIGLTETIELLSSEGRKPLSSLLLHVSENHSE